ncbi:MAG: hypothetical protein SFX19_01505 [Alphaproteobacteria bacterium]|nr:hypothetical protein [Alphaproteobacteria bacterium]
MGALTDFQAVKNSIEKGRPYSFVKNSITGNTTRLMSYYAQAPNAGATPSTAVTCNAASPFALLQEPEYTSLNNYFLTQAELAVGVNTSSIFTSLMLIDRLSHQGGLSGTVTTAQTTNLPTAALPRYTSGEGVMMALEIYTSVGSTTAANATVSYTNQAGVSGRTSKIVILGGTTDFAASRFIILPLQDDDTGVRSVQSVTLSANTGSAGNFGVTLFKPLSLFPSFSQAFDGIQPRTFNTLIGGFGCCPEILNDACLGLLGFANSTNPGVITGAFYLAEA